ncbi:MAG: hypothetical protein JW784_02950 [Candidatus Cloacimonetes bacterium]|nr:hypothetical protein [Candidatus Cloacimonadota bacterium]
MKKKYRCFALFSGGLDSMLAARLMQDLGYEVIPVFFRTPFFEPDQARQAAAHIGFKLLVIDISAEHLQMLGNPRYGFGKNFNPCIDCHALMFHRAGEMMPEYAVDFLISGEVVGQRPMSQRPDALNAVGKLSGYKDLLIRPLSQKLLPDTLPIREGWVDKEKMLAIQGRGRSRQMEMARTWGITSYRHPGGGCLLTDVVFSRKLRDLIKYGQLNLQQVELLKYGRHFRLSAGVKLIVGRHEQDNDNLQALAEGLVVLQTPALPGPLAVMNTSEIPPTALLQMAAGLLLRYNNKIIGKVQVNYGIWPHTDNILSAEALSSDEVEEYRI